MSRPLAFALVTTLLFAACSSDGGSTSAPGPTGVTTDPLPTPQGMPAEVDPNPTAPKDDSGKDLAWQSAPLMEGVQVIANRDSAIVIVPAIDGAADYRVIGLPSGVAVSTDAMGGEHIDQSTLHCAGYRQHNAPATPKRELLRVVEVTGLLGPTRLAVEAIASACPFPGALGGAHVDLNAQNPEIDSAAQGPFAIYSEDEVRAKYGSLIVNGHGPASKPGQPAPPSNPKVLARTAIKVTPLGTASPITKTFFDDFSSPDQPSYVMDLPTFDRGDNGKLYQNSNYSIYSYNDDAAQVTFARGQMRMLVADQGQDVMASNVAFLRKPVALSDTDFLHVTYEVDVNATSRRYAWLVLCGASAMGQTLDAQGKLMGNLIETPFFMDADGRNPSVEGWNCLQIFNRQGWSFPLPPDNTNPESELRVMVNKAGDLGRSNVVDVSPLEYSSTDIGPPSWFRTRDAAGNLVGKVLDDEQLIAPRTRFDVFVRRDRVVFYVNGQQRVCNDLGADGKLTMAEGALGLGQVFYHSGAERLEFSASFFDRTGERYYLENTPFIDVRSFDNVGYDEHVALPAGFDASVCYAPK